MKRHLYYQLHFTLISPMNISSGENNHTDSDVLLDGSGKPYIPGSSLAGVLRSLVPGGEDGKRQLFGSPSSENDREDQGSPVIVYDARLKEGRKAKLDQRDHVRLNQYRTAVDKAKFDEECIEAGAEFIGFLEVDGDASVDCEKNLDRVLKKLAAQKCGFGRKTTRGFGRADLEVRKKAFDLENEEDRSAWLDFDPFHPAAFEDGEMLDLSENWSDGIHIQLALELTGGISIRVYLTDPNNGNDINSADYTTIKSNGLPVIPGTSWAGAFRHRFQEIASQLGDDGQYEKALFGYVIENTSESHKSSVTFSETVLHGSRSKTLTRNAIDRVSGKTKDSALYTEETAFGGKGTLDIRIRRDVPGQALSIFGACVCDLIHGYLAVGGLTSVGRGLFRAETVLINGNPLELKSEGWENSLISKVKECAAK